MTTEQYVWKLSAFGASRLALPGVPWRDLMEAEYQAACSRYPGMEEHGYFYRLPEPSLADEPGKADKEHPAEKPEPPRRRVKDQEDRDNG